MVSFPELLRGLEQKHQLIDLDLHGQLHPQTTALLETPTAENPDLHYERLTRAP